LASSKLSSLIFGFIRFKAQIRAPFLDIHLVQRTFAADVPSPPSSHWLDDFEIDESLR
jgi:hypothetical protein